MRHSFLLFFSICRNKWRKLEILVDLGEIGKGVEGVTRKGSIAIFLPIQSKVFCCMYQLYILILLLYIFMLNTTYFPSLLGGKTFKNKELDS